MATKQFGSGHKRLIALWILRTLSPAFGRSLFLNRFASTYSDSEVTVFLDLPPEPDDETFLKFPRILDDLQKSLENGSPAALSARSKTNFNRFAASLKLNSTEQCILEFFACMEIEVPLADTCLLVQKLILTEAPRFFSKILDLPRDGVAKALAPGGRLIKCGLLKCSKKRRDVPMAFHSEALAARLLRNPYDSNKLLKLFGVVSTSPPKLGLQDFPHLQTSLDLLLPYLKTVQKRRKSGVNVLIHGAPGTGKSELVRVLGQAMGMAVFELDTADHEGDPLDAKERLSVLNLAQTYFNDLSVLLVFDEAEDILTPSLSHRGMANTHKGWFNQMLEKNRQPVFWISNSIQTLDPAFSRRFDFIMEVPIPPKSQRGRILREKAGKLISSGLIEHLSGIEHLAPAVVTRARSIIQAIRGDIPEGNRDVAFSHIISGVLKAQGHPDPGMTTIQRVQPGLYDIAHLNTSADLSQIAANLRHRPSARLCLYGPPGTGKTSFGHWLANEIGQPLLLKKASDLLSPYVGVTEQKIARTFETAKQDGAVLLIDEVDSFLRDRTHSKHSWEVTQINEMLTQIESFPGILIATTNLIDQLDPASMRRFDIKLHFGYLLPEQAIRLFASYCRNLNLAQPSTADLELVATMDVSTPGDFAAVARQHRFQPFRDARGLVKAVIAESDLKTNRTRRIGFQ